jgi:hypothetical protein
MPDPVRTQDNVDAYRNNLFAAGETKLGGTATITANQQRLANANAEWTSSYNDYNTLIRRTSPAPTTDEVTTSRNRLTAAELERNAAKLLPISQQQVDNLFTYAGTNYVTVENQFYNQIGPT